MYYFYFYVVLILGTNHNHNLVYCYCYCYIYHGTLLLSFNIYHCSLPVEGKVDQSFYFVLLFYSPTMDYPWMHHEPVDSRYTFLRMVEKGSEKQVLRPTSYVLLSLHDSLKLRIERARSTYFKASNGCVEFCVLEYKTITH